MSRIERGEDEQRIAGARTGSDDGVDRSPRVANRAAFTKPAEISGYEIVTHYFAGAADRLGLADGLQAVVQSGR
jgi:hypothetical protein